MAERLYITRQAVSKWEHGARYPDLLTVKKIAQILELSVDELLSGEKLKENVEKSPVLSMPVENTIQTVLYAVALTGYMLILVFGIYSLFPDENLAKLPAGQITLKSYGIICIDLVYVVSLSIGLVFSIKNELSAKITGYIGISAWFPDFIVPLLFAVYILLFFIIEERRLPYGIILLICTLSIGNLAHIMMRRLIGPYRTDLGLG